MQAYLQIQILFHSILNGQNGDKANMIKKRKERIRKFSIFTIIESSSVQTWHSWLDYVWKAGTRIVPKTIIDEEGNSIGKGCLRRIKLIGKWGIQEKIIDTDFPRQLTYQVQNPSWFTFPVTYHKGIIIFSELEGDQTSVSWTINYIPKFLAGGIVKLMLKLSIPTYIRRWKKNTKK